MKRSMYIALAIACIMVIAGTSVALASGGEQNGDGGCGDRCEVEIPECHGCYVMTAEASLEADHDGIEVEGSSTVITRKVGTTTEVEIEADGGQLELEVGSSVDRHPTEILTYSIFSGNTGHEEADIEMDTTVVVGGTHRHTVECLVNADADLDVETLGGMFEGGTVATYGQTPDEDDGRMNQIMVDQYVSGHIGIAEGDAEANNNLVPGTVFAGVEISPSTAETYAGATFYLRHFHHGG